jgi:hypothetical protein
MPGKKKLKGKKGKSKKGGKKKAAVEKPGDPWAKNEFVSPLKPGKKVSFYLFCKPVYHPFYFVKVKLNRNVIECQFLLSNTRQELCGVVFILLLKLALQTNLFQLIQLLTTQPADVRDVHGVKVSTRVLQHLTPQEVRDLRAVFEIFDSDSDG